MVAKGTGTDLKDIEPHVLQKDTGFISAAGPEGAIDRFNSQNGLAVIDVDAYIRQGGRFISHDSLLQNLTDPDAITFAVREEPWGHPTSTAFATVICS